MSCETEEIHVGDVGTALIAVFHEANGSIKDISSATLLQIILTDPDGTSTTYTASLTTDGTDGQAQYVTAATSDLATAGFWWLRGYIEQGGTSKHHSNKVKFQVFPSDS
jgi:hypothetical protein